MRALYKKWRIFILSLVTHESEFGMKTLKKESTIMYGLLHFSEVEICAANSLSWTAIHSSDLNPDRKMGWGKCHCGCAEFVKQYGNDICGRCGHNYSEHY
jgi:hypothetical protein